MRSSRTRYCPCGMRSSVGTSPAAAPAELVKKKGAYVYDEVTGQWKMNAELEAKKKERQEEYAFYRSLFQQCANEVAQLRDDVAAGKHR